MTPEERSISSLKSAPYEISDEAISALEEFFRQLRRIDQQLTYGIPD
jgi:hypothetical protein